MVMGGQGGVGKVRVLSCNLGALKRSLNPLRSHAANQNPEMGLPSPLAYMLALDFRLKIYSLKQIKLVKAPVKNDQLFFKLFYFSGFYRVK
jgi:hypothetical protein